jgi:hypothetical protein
MKHRSAFAGLVAVLFGCGVMSVSAEGVPSVQVNPNYAPDIEKIQEGIADVQAGQNSNDPREVEEGVGDIIGGLNLGGVIITNCAPSSSNGAVTQNAAPGGVPTSNLTLPIGGAGNAASQAVGQASNLLRNHPSH